MQTIHIPEGYQQIMPYLILKDANGFIEFMKSIFNAEEKLRHMRDEHIIMHAEINIGSCTFMLADSTEDYATAPGAFFIYVSDADATYHKAIAAGATVVTAISDQPYGRSGGIKDPFGNTWWVTTQTLKP